MATHDRQRSTERQASVSGGTVALQCVASMAGTLIGESLGPTLAAKLVVGVLGALIGAFLTAPGRHRRRRIVAVALLIALLDALRRAAGALAAERRQEPRAWVPANWVVVGLTAVAGFGAGSAVTTVRGAWAEERAAFASVPDVRGEPRSNALAILAAAGLRASTATEPSETIAAGSATRTNPAAGASVEAGADVTLYVSAGPPGATVTVPDVTGRLRAEALALLRDVGLRPEPGTEPSRTIEDGHVTRTDPPAGTDVDRGSAVTVLVSSGPVAGPVRIPDVRGEPGATAMARLRDAGLRPRSDGEPSEDIDEGSATRTDPAAGTEVDRGAAVTLFLSTGPAVGTVRVPNVVGSTREQAYAALEDAGLRPEGSTEASEAVAAGTVVRSDPAAGTTVEEGSPVQVVVSSGPPPLVVPDVAGLPSAEAMRRLKLAGLAPAIEDATSSAVPEGIVIATEPEAGSEVDRGDQVNVLVSCGPESCIQVD